MHYIVDNQSASCWGTGTTEDGAWADYEAVAVDHGIHAEPERVRWTDRAFRQSGCCPTVLACVQDEDLDAVVGERQAEAWRRGAF